jgi:hypothetical protein
VASQSTRGGETAPEKPNNWILPKEYEDFPAYRERILKKLEEIEP